MRSNDFNASGSYASYSRYRTRRPTLWLRTRPRNVTTAPSAPAFDPALASSAAASRSSSSDSGPIARSGVVTLSVYRWESLIPSSRLPEMIEWAVAVTDSQGVRDRARDVLLGARGRVGKRAAQREVCGDR